MLAKLRRSQTFANVCSLMALTVALGTGGAYAANTIGGADVIDESLTSADIKNGEVKAADIGESQVLGSRIVDETVKGADIANNRVTGLDVNEGTLEKVPSAANADSAAAVKPGAVTSEGIKEGAVGHKQIRRATPWSFVGDERCWDPQAGAVDECPQFTGGWWTHERVREYGPTSRRYAMPSYYRDVNGVVHLRGLMNGGTPGTSPQSYAFSLPDAYSPATARAFAVVSNNAPGRVNVFPNGDVQVEVGSTNWVSLDGISFRAADTDAQEFPQG